MKSVTKSVMFPMASVVLSISALAGVAQAQGIPADVVSIECKYQGTGEQYLIRPVAPNSNQVIVTPAQLVTFYSATAGPRKVLSERPTLVYQIKAIEGGFQLQNDQLQLQADRKFNLKSADGVTATLEKLYIENGLPGFGRGNSFVRTFNCVINR